MLRTITFYLLTTGCLSYLGWLLDQALNPRSGIRLRSYTKHGQEWHRAQL